MEGKESEQKELGNHLELAIKISRGIVKSRNCEVAEFFLTPCGVAAQKGR